MPRKNPKYVINFIDRQGKERWYVRRKGVPLVPVPPPSSPEFRGAYNSAIYGVPEIDAGATPLPTPKVGRKSIKYDTPGYVYFLVCGPRVKIGFSTNPFGRVGTLKTGLPSAITTFIAVPGTFAHEKRLHRLLDAQRVSGEWFAAEHPAVQKVMARAAAYGKIDLEPGPRHFFSREARAERAASQGGVPKKWLPDNPGAPT